MNDVRYIGNSMTGNPDGPAWFHFAVGGSKNVVIRDNHWFDLTTREGNEGKYGIFPRPYVEEPITNVTITGNTFEADGTLKQAIRWEAPSETVTITDNTITEPGREGIWVRNATDVRVENNSVVDPNAFDEDGRSGVWFTQNDDLHVRGNSVRDTRDRSRMRIGVTLLDTGEGAGAVVADNHVEGASDTAYEVALTYPNLRWNGLGYNSGDPSVTGQWNTHGEEGLTIRDTENDTLYLYNGGQWTSIGGYK
jgi:hypothetical protein